MQIPTHNPFCVCLCKPLTCLMTLSTCTQCTHVQRPAHVLCHLYLAVATLESFVWILLCYDLHILQETCTRMCVPDARLATSKSCALLLKAAVLGGGCCRILRSMSMSMHFLHHTPSLALTCNISHCPYRSRRFCML